MKTSEGDNTEQADGSIKVWFGNQVEVKITFFSFQNDFVLVSIIHIIVLNLSKLTPIISDPEYLLDQHILICVKSADSDESYGEELTCTLCGFALSWATPTICHFVFPEGEGCVALRAAQFCYREFQITLTHHGEKTGTLTGGIKLRTSEGKPTEKLYGEAWNQLQND